MGHIMPETGSAPAPLENTNIEDEPKRVLTPQAQRALAEAAERRAARDATETERAKEIGGRNGPDPVRYGDWEQGGIAWDF